MYDIYIINKRSGLNEQKEKTYQDDIDNCCMHGGSNVFIIAMDGIICDDGKTTDAGRSNEVAVGEI